MTDHVTFGDAQLTIEQVVDRILRWHRGETA